MLSRLLRRLTYLLERFVVRSAYHQLAFIAALIVLVSVVSGTIVYLAVPGFGDYSESVWWGFLRLSDPGYLGDDEGAVSRTVSTVVTVLGYVLFMGALIAIMNQGLGRMMRRLESGVTPISLKGHILILGWTNRTQAILRELLLSKGRVQRFLRLVRADRLKIVVMAEAVTSNLAYELKTSLGELWDADTLILRSGNPLHTEHLERVDFLNAAAIILPASDFAAEGAEAMDARLIKTILSVSNAGDGAGGRTLPILTTELFDARKVSIAQAAYAGNIEIVPNSTVISRLIAQNVRHGGLSSVYSELLAHGEGNEIYVREFPALVGTAFAGLGRRFPGAIPLGVIRPGEGGSLPLLNPPGDLIVADEDRLVFIADRYEAIAPDNSGAAAEPSPAAVAEPPRTPERPVSRKVLFLGWSHKTPALLREFQSYTGERFDVTTVSRVPAEERHTFIERFAGDLSRLQVRHLEADYTAPYDLENLRPQDYDNVVFLASDWLASGEESDARTVLGYLLLRTILADSEKKPEVLIELMDPESQSLFVNRPGEILVSPLILSHMLAHITLRRDLRVIFEELFTTGGAEIYFRPPGHYGVESGTASFETLQRRVAARGDIALGVYVGDETRNGKRLHLNPPRSLQWSLAEGDELVVLTTYT